MIDPEIAEIAVHCTKKDGRDHCHDCINRDLEFYECFELFATAIANEVRTTTAPELNACMGITQADKEAFFEGK